MTARLAHWRHQVQSERGATAVEYALMVAFLALVIITAVILLGNNLSGIFADAGARI